MRKLSYAIALALSGTMAVQAQQGDDLIEEVVVTGTYLKGRSQFDSASPITVIDAEDISNIGAVTIDDFTDTLTINTGSQNNPDAFTQNFSTGTTNINLRGLGVGSTLVLLNGRRQVRSGAVTDNGESFVDTASLVPVIAIQRVETLKDGATSLYGTDAVAGVVNFITRSDFRGLEVSTRYQESAADQSDVEIGAIWGTGNESTDFILAFNYLDRDPLTTAERPFASRADVSLFGQPGSFVVPFQPTGPDPVTAAVWGIAFDSNGNGVADFFEGLSPTLPLLADPDCPAVAAQDPNILAPATFPAGACQFDFGLFYNLVPEEERVSVFAELNHEFASGMRFRGEFGYADNSAERGNSPSFPVLALPGIAADNPFNPFGVPVNFVGRVAGAFGEPFNSTHDSETYRFVAELEGTAGEWDWTTALSLSSNEYFLTAPDTLREEFFAALNGGVYNPFGSQYFDQPNDPSVIAGFTDRTRVLAEADQLVFDAVATRDIFEAGGGTAGLAVGIQYRDDELSYDYDANANRDNFLFLVGNPDFTGDRDVFAIFGELGIPLSDTFELNFALRYEDYGDDVDSTDPKLSFIWRPVDNFTLRGSAGTSFRAPSLFQEFGTQTSLQQLVDPLSPGLSFRAVRSFANPNSPLVPEEADIFNLGSSWAITDNFELSLDYWSFDYTDIIIKESAQAILNANPTGPQVIRDPDSGVLLRVETFYTNASSLETDGFDLGMDWDITDSFRISSTTTFVTSYDLADPQAGNIDGAGSRNFNNFGTSVPEIRSNLGFHYASGQHSANAYARFIDSYQDDQNNVGIDSFTTLDLQYGYRTEPLGPFADGIGLSFGVVNATDEEPPGVITNGGYDSKVHDPRGRVYYVNATFGF